jgi:hypothetical protein
VELGMIPTIEIRNNHVTVKFALPSLDVLIQQDLTDSVHHTVAKLQGGLEVMVVLW